MALPRVKKTVEGLKGFKNVTINVNESKNIFDIYARVLGDEAATKDIFNNIENLEYTYCDFGIFEFWFSPENEKQVLDDLKANFNA